MGRGEEVTVHARAVVLTGPRSLHVREFPVPDDPPPGGAILQVTANGLCEGDFHLYSGIAASEHAPFPLVPGHEIVGRLAAVDPEAARLWDVREGDRVAVEAMLSCGTCAECRAGRERFCPRPGHYGATSIRVAPALWGGMAEYVALRPGTRLHRVPPHLDDLDAGLLNAFSNAFEWTARTGRVRPGDVVLITGCGQRGLACAAIAREAGAATVVVTAGRRDVRKRALAPRFGADDVVDADTEGVVDAVHDRVGKRGVDVVIDTASGDPSTITDAITVLRNEGTLVLAGMKGRPAGDLRTDRIHRKALTIRGAFATTPWSSANAMRLLARGRYPFASMHSHVVGLDDVEPLIQLLGGERTDDEVIHATVDPRCIAKPAGPR